MREPEQFGQQRTTSFDLRATVELLAVFLVAAVLSFLIIARTEGASSIWPLFTSPISPISPISPPPTRPANDAFAAASSLNIPARVTGNTLGATTETGEPGVVCGYGIGRTVWFQFVPSTTGTLTATTAGSNFDTMLALYTGGSSFSFLSQTACNDDADGTVRSRITTHVLGGQTYSLQLGGFNGLGGTYLLQVSLVPDPVYGALLSPAVSTVGLPGVSATATLRITNTGNITDTFDLSYASASWTANGPQSAGPLGPGGVADLDVTVAVPGNAGGGQSNTVAITATSRGNRSETVTARLTVTALSSYGVVLGSAPAQSASPGTTVTHTLRVTNTGNVTDTFGLTYLSSSWPVSGPGSVGPLAAGRGADVSVTIGVPGGATGGQIDTATVTATSQGDTARSSRTQLTTSAANAYGFALGASLTQLGLPGTAVTYTLRITNTGNVADTFTLRYAGNIWPTTGPASTASIPSGASTDIRVTVSVPNGASGGQLDAVTVTATSQGDAARSASAQLTTSAANIYGLMFGPSLTQLAQPGTTVTYTLRITNTGNMADTFSLSYGGNVWPAIGAASTASVPPGAGADIRVTVNVPEATAGGQSDGVTITATSRGDPTRSATAQLTTTAISTYRLMLTAAGTAQSALPGASVTYTLRITNGGNTVDTFAMAYQGNSWPVTSPITVGPVASGGGVDVLLIVEVPAGAATGATDSVAVTVTSQRSATQSTTVRLTTTAGTRYGVGIAPSVAAQSALASTAVTYPLRITNTGNITDTFSLSYTAKAFAASGPAGLGPLAAGGAADASVTVNIPAGVAPGTSDTLTIRAASVGDPSKSAVATLTTSATSATVGPAPVVIAVQPSVGENTALTFLVAWGANFRSGARVALERSGSQSALTDPLVVDDDTILATIPTGFSPGTYDVLVTNADGTVGRLIGGFTVISKDPIPNRVRPIQATNDAAATITVVGFNFESGISATLEKDGVSQALADVSRLNRMRVRAVVPAGLAPGVYDLVLRNPDTSTGGRLTNAFTILSLLNDDFSIAADDIWTNPPTLRTNATVRLGVNLHRRGGKTTVQVPVRFYLGDPATGGLLIGEKTSVPIAPQTENETVSADWQIGPRLGGAMVYVVVDPAGTISETTKANNVVSRTLTILPAVTSGDSIPPEITGMTINGGASEVSNPDLLVAVGASDPVPGSGVARMLLIERQLNTASHTWEAVNDTGWVTYTTPYQMTLTEDAGTRYIQAFVADGAGNISVNRIQRQISYVPSTDRLLQNQVRVYRRPVSAGQSLSVRVEPVSGDADLYVWDPNNNSVLVRNGSDTAVDEGTITTTMSGIYQIEVYAYTDTTYQIKITGGTAAASPSSIGARSLRMNAEKTARMSPVILAGNEPEDNVAVPQAPVGVITATYRLYLPVATDAFLGVGW